MAAELEYESVLCVKPDVSVYRIPPRASNRGYRYRVGFAAGDRQDNDCVLGQHTPARAVAPERSLNILLDLDSPAPVPTSAPAPAPASTSNDLWGDFSTASSSVPNQAPQPSNWVQF